MVTPASELLGNIRQNGARFLQQVVAVQDAASSPSGQVKRLPELAGAICGASAEQVAPVQSLWNLLYQTLKLLDDLEDGDFEPARWPIASGSDAPAAVALNFSTGLLARLGVELAQLPARGLDPAVAQDIQLAFFGTLESMCAGQHDDLAHLHPDLDTCWAVARAKSGFWFGLGSWAGGRVGTADPEQLMALHHYGVQLGLLVQIKDDAGDLWGDEAARSDLTEPDRWTLPIAYAMSVLEEPARQELHALLQRAAGDLAAEAAARQIIIDSGAALFLAVKAREARHAALTALDIFSHRQEAQAMLADLIESLDFSPQP